MPPSQRILRTYSEWVDFFADHFDDETLYDACRWENISKTVADIATEANMLKSVALLRFDHETMDRFSRNRFIRIETIATQVLEAVEEEDYDVAIQLLRDDFEKAILTVCPNVPFGQMVNCDIDL